MTNDKAHHHYLHARQSKAIETCSPHVLLSVHFCIESNSYARICSYLKAYTP